MLTFEELKPSLMKCGRYYHLLNTDFEPWDLIGAAWQGGRIQKLKRKEHASIAVCRAMIEYMRDTQHRRAKNPPKIKNITSLLKNEYAKDYLIKNTVYGDVCNKFDDKEWIDNLLKGFNREEKLIVKLRFYEGFSLCEIGKVIGVTEGSVSQKLKKILQRLKAKLTRVET